MIESCLICVRVIRMTDMCSVWRMNESCRTRHMYMCVCVYVNVCVCLYNVWYVSESCRTPSRVHGCVRARVHVCVCVMSDI